MSYATKYHGMHDGKGVISSFHEAMAECNFTFSYRKD